MAIVVLIILASVLAYPILLRDLALSSKRLRSAIVQIAETDQTSGIPLTPPILLFRTPIRSVGYAGNVQALCLYEDGLRRFRFRGLPETRLKDVDILQSVDVAPVKDLRGGRFEKRVRLSATASTGRSEGTFWISRSDLPRLEALSQQS